MKKNMCNIFYVFPTKNNSLADLQSTLWNPTKKEPTFVRKLHRQVSEIHSISKSKFL